MTRAVRRLPGLGKRAVLYLRQSKDREDSESIENQEHLGREYCATHGYDIVAVHVDRITGRKWDTRPGVKATLELIEQHHADVIVLWKWSRLSRSRLHWAVAADRVLMAGGRIEAVTEPLDTTTAAGRFARGMMIEYADFQSDQIGEVWSETLARRVRQGKPATGRPRLGYVRDREADTYTPDPMVAPLVAELYDRYISGQGAAAITRWFNDQGQRTKHGHMWTATNLIRVLDHGFPAGKIYHHDQIIEGAHDAIIDRETWDAYLARRASHTKGPRGSVRMLSGLLRCECGGSMFSVRSTADSGTYGCAKKHRGDGSCPYRCQIDRSNAELFVSEWIAALPHRVDLLRDAAKREASARVRAIDDRAAIARLIQRAETRLATLTMKLLDNEVSQSAYDLASKRLNDDLATLRERYVRSAPMPQTDLFSRIPTLVDGWSSASPAVQNRVARLLIDRIVVHPPSRSGPGLWRERIEVIPRWDD